MHKAIIGRGAAYADYDRDGDQDFLIVENKGPVYLWRNDRHEGNALRIHLQGTRSNLDGIGAEIVAYVAGEPQARRIRAGGSYLSQSERVATISLALSNSVDSVLVM